MHARPVRMAGDGQDDIGAYLATPDAVGPRGGVVVIHHLPGLDRATREMVRRFAALGYDAICPDLYSREAPGRPPEEASALIREKGGIPDDRLVGDVAGAAAFLRSLPHANGRVGVIGYCSGGRHAVLAACSLPLEAAVDCYGAYVTGTPPADFPLRVTNLTDRLPELGCPLLGLFGAEDRAPSPQHVAELESRLAALGKDFDLHSYPGAGHAFFAVDRPAFRAEAALDGWSRIGDFFGRHLAAAAG